MKTQKSTLKKSSPGRKREHHPVLPYILTPGIALLLLALFRLTRSNTALMDWLIRYITGPYKEWISGLADMLPGHLSLAELVIGIFFLCILLFLIQSIICILRRPGKLLRLIRRLIILGSVALWVYCGYTLLWGINYYGTSFTAQTGLERRGATAEELYQLTVAFIDKANDLSDQVERDENGSFCTDTDEIFAESEDIFSGIVTEYPFLEGTTHKPKGMIASRFMDYISYTGFYFPFTAEANLNLDPPNCLLPVTVVHELCHQRNVANEDEANFAAILTCIRSDNVTYQYSGCLLAYIELGNALYKADHDLWEDAYSRLNEDVKTDMQDNNAFWDSFHETKTGQVAQKSADKIYSAFAESYGETDVMQRYEACVELLVAYYFDN